MDIKVSNLTHIFSQGMPFETIALNGITCDIKEGEFAAIIGRTGSGKTTLVQHIAGLLKPTSGSVDADRKKIGIVFQYPEYQLFEETVLKDVCFGPKNLGFNEEEAEVLAKDALRLVGIDPELMGALSPFNLSGGEKRRVAIAGVLAMKPEVLILDEPTAGLDPKGHDGILEMINDIKKKKNLTIILVSHNMDDVEKYAEHVLVMHDGKLVMDDSPKEVFKQGEKLIGIGLGLPWGETISNSLRERGKQISKEVLSYEDLLGALK